ncbi:MAG: 6-pyruvoyl trahydropterin synthase family protein [Candidatus Kariarchaeaceae archaeon]|jgi:6-pyruvoyltetrahydropterin/6-carboxytetrahydropterin synthase
MQLSKVTVHKIVEISSSHQLNLPYESKCNNLHGHNFKIEVWITGKLDEYGMVIDFNKIKKEIMRYDHQHLNDILENPTAENLALSLSQNIIKLSSETINSVKIRVWETSSAYAESKLNQ